MNSHGILFLLHSLHLSVENFIHWSKNYYLVSTKSSYKKGCTLCLANLQLWHLGPVKFLYSIFYVLNIFSFEEARSYKSPMESGM